MTVSLDSPLSGGAGEGRQRLQRAAARAVGFIGKMARNPLTAIGHRRRNYLSAAGGGDFRAADCAL